MSIPRLQASKPTGICYHPSWGLTQAKKPSNSDFLVMNYQALSMIAAFQYAITSAGYHISNSVKSLSDEISRVSECQKQTAKVVQNLFDLTMATEMQDEEVEHHPANSEPPPGMYS